MTLDYKHAFHSRIRLGEKKNCIYFSGCKALTAQLLFSEGCYYFSIAGLKVGFGGRL